MTQRWKLSWALLLAMTTVGGAAGQDTASKPANNPPPAKPAAEAKPPVSAPGVAANDATYVIGPEDALSINVWKEPELSGSMPVRPDGKISLPLLGDVQAAGVTPMQLMTTVTEKLKNYVADPRVTVVVTAINSRRVFLIGEVLHAGAFALIPDMTVLQALSMAGGFTQYANPSKIYVLRAEGGKQVKYPFNYKAVVKGENSEQNLALKPGDTIVVP